MISRTNTTANGATASFNYPYPFIDQAHLKVYVNGALKSITTHYTITSGSPINGQPTVNIVFNAGHIPTNGQRVQIIRRSGGTLSAPAVSFVDGHVLKQQDLKDDSIQAFYLCQEALDDFENTLQFTYDNKLDAGNRELTNLAAPTAPTSAVTAGYLESYALGNAVSVYVTQAQTAAGSASASASSASASASGASTSASNASASASSASASASSASSSASSASASATSASNALAAMDQGSAFPDVPNGSDYDSSLLTGAQWNKQEFYSSVSPDGLLYQTRRLYTPANSTGSPVDYDVVLHTALQNDVYGIFVSPWNDVAVDFKISHVLINGTWVATNTLTATFVTPQLSSSNQLTAIRIRKPTGTVATVLSVLVIGR